MKKVKQVIRQIKISFIMLKSSSGLLIIPYFFIQIIISTIGILQLYILNLILDTIMTTENYLKKLFIQVTLYIFIIAFSKVIILISNNLFDIIHQKLEHYYQMEVKKKIDKLPMEFLDSSEGRNSIDDVSGFQYSICEFPFRIQEVSMFFYSFLIAAGILIRYNLLLVLLFLIVTFPGVLWNNSSKRKIYNWTIKAAPDARKYCYYRWMLTDPWPAKDMRMYDLTDDIKGKYEYEKKEYLRKRDKLDREGLYFSLLSIFVKEIGIIIFTISIIWDAINKRITIGEVTMYLGLAGTIISSFEGICNFVINAFGLFLYRFEKFINFMKEKEEVLYSTKKKKEIKEFRKIEFIDVYFKYPYSENYILKGISFAIYQGEKISLVGVNGAGKTTIIKLMLGLYQIEKGQILLNGFPMEEYDIKDISALFTVLFQSFANYPLTLRENVALSKISEQQNDDKIKECLNKSGISLDKNKFRNGLDTYMTRSFDDRGVELSKGQWQKIALARTYFKNAPVVIFDEPSSALDAEAEDKIFQNFNTMTDNRTGVMISHRISSSRMANKILVLSGGEIKETGTHEELIKKNGIYKKLYQLQLKKYTMQEEL